MQLFNEGNVDDAIKLLKKISLTASDDEKFNIIELYSDFGFVEEAIMLVEDLLKTYPTEGQLITKLAELYIELGKDDFAVNLLNDVERDDSFYVPSLIQLADLYQTQGLFEVSEQKLLEAKQILPEEIVIDFALGELLFSIGQFNRAITFYEKVVQEKDEINSISLRERLAECHAMVGNYEQALQFYEEVNSKNPDTLFKFGFTASQQNRNDIAIKVWKELVELDPHYHTVYYELASAMEKEGLFTEAYDVVKQGLDYDEFNKELFFLAGKLASQLQHEAESIDYLNEAIALDNDYKEAILSLIQLYKSNHQYEEVIELISSIKQVGAEDPVYDWELARALCEEEKYKEALLVYKEASIHLQHDTDFLKEYGYFLTEEGLVKEAIKTLQKYVELEPLDEEVISFVERLNFSINE